MKLYIQSTRPGMEDKRFEVLAYDPETKKGKVIGGMGTEFETDMSKESLLQYGYRIIKED